MKKIISFLSIALALTSCTAEPLNEDISPKPKTIQATTTNTFTVKWDSNQDGSYIEFQKHVFKDCKVISTVYEAHREREFTIALENGQMFDMQIRHEAPKKNPELYLSIYKGDVLQYEQEINSQGFLMTNFCDYKGDIGTFN